MGFESCSSPLIRSLARTLADRTSGRAAFQLLQDETWALRSACQEPDTSERVLTSFETPRCPQCAAASCSPKPRPRNLTFVRLLADEFESTLSATCNRGNFLSPMKALKRRTGSLKSEYSSSLVIRPACARSNECQRPHVPYISSMKPVLALLAVLLPTAAFGQTTGPTPEQLRALQLRLNEQQQQLNQLRLRQPSTIPRDQQLQSLQNQLDRQRLELQRLKLEQQSCLRGRC